jgi:hypothetical protein
MLIGAIAGALGVSVKGVSTIRISFLPRLGIEQSDEPDQIGSVKRAKTIHGGCSE